MPDRITLIPTVIGRMEDGRNRWVRLGSSSRLLGLGEIFAQVMGMMTRINPSIALQRAGKVQRKSGESVRDRLQGHGFRGWKVEEGDGSSVGNFSCRRHFSETQQMVLRNAGG